MATQAAGGVGRRALPRPDVQPLARADEAKLACPAEAPLACPGVHGLTRPEIAEFTRAEAVELGGAAEPDLARRAPATLAGTEGRLLRAARRATHPGRRLHRDARVRNPGAMDLPDSHDLPLG